ncbi:hypothetical protein Y032_0067g57 [Ancylostoma ceylanicum]|uniref:SCP domain-containing protein n=1 Tax=Ancylostoma ceylanicum TaxID=53326 RepID=A0A016TZK8_9BILA|nr:hypothetical protein Y032_0067g57 [Ancylostoma ceylanicum]
MKLYFAVSIVVLGIAHANDSNFKCSRKPDNIPEFNEEMRESFVDTHDIYRLTFAQENQASKMRKMVYDCATEQSAYDAAVQSCETTTFTYRKYLKNDENFYVIDYIEDVADVVSHVGDSWWSEKSRIDGKKPINVYRSSYNISNFANVCYFSLLRKKES